MTGDAIPHPTVTPLAGSLGVRIDGVDVAGDSSATLVDALRTILDQHLVIHLPGQDDLTPDQHREFASRWGEIAVPPARSVDDTDAATDTDETNRLDAPDAPDDFATVWQQDATYVAFPPSVVILVAREVPEVGGDTMWANQYAAYGHLTSGLREALEGLYAVHEGPYRGDDDGPRREAITSVHPVVATHDRTERKVLFVNPRYTTRFDGWSAEESAPLLEYLARVAVREEFTCRHRWAVGDLVIWDNRATLHRAVLDVAPGGRRVLDRVAVAGLMPY